MGGNILWREILKRYMFPVLKQSKQSLLTAFFFIIIGLTSVIAQEEGRPLRSIPPNSPPNQMFNPAPSSQLPNSLITETSLNQTLTRRYIAQYSSPHGIATLNAIMERARIYMPFIREEVEKRGLPPELIYLPVIESGFQITARSRSGAMGLWQFMMNSISPFDIKVTDLVDERRDFIKSTKGALQKLENEHRRLGNWELTLAAYNSGLGAVTRTIQRTGINDYWELSERKELRAETIQYVPKFVAAAYVLSQPRRFGINVWHEKFEWEAIPLKRQISIDIIADESGLSRDLMRRLNAELQHGISPLDSHYRLKIPATHVDTITALLEREDLRLIRYHYHIVRHGDTLWSMSRHYGTSLPMIEQHNPGITNRYLRIGETIIIPAYNEISPPAPVSVVPQNYPGTHVVQKGETFWSLGRMYGVNPQTLAESNNMQLNQILREGRTINVPIIE